MDKARTEANINKMTIKTIASLSCVLVSCVVIVASLATNYWLTFRGEMQKSVTEGLFSRCVHYDENHVMIPPGGGFVSSPSNNGGHRMIPPGNNGGRMTSGNNGGHRSNSGTNGHRMSSGSGGGHSMNSGNNGHRMSSSGNSGHSSSGSSRSSSGHGMSSGSGGHRMRRSPAMDPYDPR